MYSPVESLPFSVSPPFKSPPSPAPAALRVPRERVRTGARPRESNNRADRTDVSLITHDSLSDDAEAADFCL